MYNGNPFRGNTQIVYESHPLDAVAPADVSAVEIHVDFASGARPRPADIDTMLSQLSGDRIRLFAIDYDSQLRRVPDLRRFINLEYLHLAGRKLASPGRLSFLRRLHTLFLVGAKDAQLSAVFPGPLKDLRLVRGNTEILDVSVIGRTKLQSCQKLREFGEVELADVELEACHHVDLKTLDRVSGLKKLCLSAPRHTDRFDFLAGCRDLVSLTVAGSPGAPTAPAHLASADFRGLAMCPTLRRVMLQLSDERIGELAENYPHLLIGNGNVCFRGREQISGGPPAKRK
jgi:hypothetical protein